jgi:hypothetical protein
MRGPSSGSQPPAALPAGQSPGKARVRRARNQLLPRSVDDPEVQAAIDAWRLGPELGTDGQPEKLKALLLRMRVRIKGSYGSFVPGVEELFKVKFGGCAGGRGIDTVRAFQGWDRPRKGESRQLGGGLSPGEGLMMMRCGRRSKLAGGSRRGASSDGAAAGTKERRSAAEADEGGHGGRDRAVSDVELLRRNRRGSTKRRSPATHRANLLGQTLQSVS